MQDDTAYYIQEVVPQLIADAEKAADYIEKHWIDSPDLIMPDDHPHHWQ